MTTSSQHSSFDENAVKSAFDQLHPTIQRWIYEQKWTELRDVQARTVAAVSTTKSDIVVVAGTASGKTEAAFLPILTAIAAEPTSSIRAMYVGPLRALINDQFYRLEQLCEALEVPVAKWHGDVQDGMKRRAREKPAGVLLITPESLEALFVRRPNVLKRMFEALDYIVIDELHTFLSTERGLQLASLLQRLELRVGVKPRRVGLSATVGDTDVARQWLRPDNPTSVIVVDDKGASSDIRLQIRGIEMPVPALKTGEKKSKSSEISARDIALRQIGDHVYKTFRGKGNHLVFAPSRREVELFADMLREQSALNGVQNEFFPHHGNLARDVRETLEARLKDGSEPTTAIATSTLELGIDIGSVESVAQLGAPRSIAALRQRLGRSGRRKGKAAVLRIYTREQPITQDSTLIDRLRLETFQSIAAVRLMLDKWIEPPLSLNQNLSTLLHQILSVIVEHSGISFKKLMATLGGPGPFSQITEATVKALLNEMANTEPPLIEQAGDQTLMLGQLGEQITERYEFFAVFKTTEEFRIVASGKTLGTVSIANAFGPDDYIVFAGQRWKVLSVDDRSKVVEVESAPAGRAPVFEGGDPAPLSDRLVEEIRVVYGLSEPPVFLDAIAIKHFNEGQSAFQAALLKGKQSIPYDSSLYLFPWRGTASIDAIRLALRREGIAADQTEISLRVHKERAGDLKTALTKLAVPNSVTGEQLAELDENLERSKFDALISRRLLRTAAATDRINAAAVPTIATELLENWAQ